MSRICVVTDSTSDLSPELTRELPITVVPLTITWEGTTYRDGIDICSREFYERLRQSPSIPVTSQPSVGAFEQVYTALLREFDQIISIHLSSRLSGTLDSAVAAAQRLGEARISVVDSTSLSIGLGWMAIRAARAAVAGREVDDILAEVERLKARTKIYLTVGTLTYLQRGGRIGRVAALAGTLLQIKPIIELRNGELFPLERVRTWPSAVRRLAELATELGPVEDLAVMHGDASEQAQQLAAMLEERLPGKARTVSEIGCVLGTHGGPGALGVCCLTSPVQS